MPANLIRMAPAGKSSGTVSANVNGRPYSCSVGSTIDVNEADAAQLEVRGFIRLGTVGATINRHAYPPTATTDPRIAANPIGMEFIDTTISAVVKWNGAAWVNVVTGAVV